MRFAVCSALGGHISKAHPGTSKAYNHKKNVREKRQLERILHKEAMSQYSQMGAKEDVNRNTIKRIKKDLVNQSDKY